MRKNFRPLFFLSAQLQMPFTVFAAIFCCALNPLAWGVSEPITLDALLSNAATKSGQVQEAQADVEAARATLSLARAAIFPQGSAMFIAAPLFEERGTATAPTNPDYTKWGPFLKTGLQVVQPLYTFGMISSYRKAAENQVIAKEHLTSVKKAEIVMMAKEFYYGYQMARDLEGLVTELVGFLEEAAKKAEEGVNKGAKDAVKPHDLFKLKVALEELKQKLLQATAARMTAEKAVTWITNTPIDALPNYPLQPEDFEKKTLDQYLAMAKEYRPEFKALAAGKEARAALRDAKAAQNYPIFFVGGYLDYGWTPTHDRQLSAYAYDPFNRLMGGVGLGVKLDLEFAKHNAEAAEQEAELNKLRATETYAIPGIELQVKRAFWELEQAMNGLEIATRRKKLGKKWFISNGMGWSIGVTPPKDLLESLEGEGTSRKNFTETVYSLNMALGHLSQAVGREVTGLKYQ